MSSFYDFIWAVLEVTDCCNAECMYCSGNHHARKSNFDPDLGTIVSIIEDLERIGCKHITLSGGEPLLRNDLPRIVSHCKKLEIETTLATNGSLLKKDTVRRLIDSGIDGIQISLDGNEQQHDSMRGKGTFIKTIQAIESSFAAGLLPSTMTVLSRVNHRNPANVLSLLESLPIKFAAFERLTGTGRGTAVSDLCLTSNELYNAFRTISLYTGNLQCVINDPLKIHFDPDLTQKGLSALNTCGGCLAGIVCGAISADGQIKICTRVPYSIGFWRAPGDLVRIWQESPVLQKLRNRTLTGHCGSCRLLLACGGCRAEAMASSGDLLSEDPGCWYMTPNNTQEF